MVEEEGEGGEAGGGGGGGGGGGEMIDLTSGPDNLEGPDKK